MRNSTFPPPAYWNALRDLGDRRGDARLVHERKAQEPGNLTGTLARQNDVRFQADLKRKEGHTHSEGSAGLPNRYDRDVIASTPEIAIKCGGN